MSIFDKKRIPQHFFKLDYSNIRKGFYSDKYFLHTHNLLSKLKEHNYSFNNTPSNRLAIDDINLQSINITDLEVQAQIFTRRPPFSVVAGIDRALAIIKNCTGHYKSDKFINTFDKLSILSAHDGIIAPYEGDPMNITPVMIIQGNYRDFALLETLILGTLSRLTKIATNTYNMLKTCGKPIMFFPARYDIHETQELDGYAYYIGLQRYNKDYNKNISPITSTDAQGFLTDIKGSGTISHSTIACFLGNTEECVLSFAKYLPVEISRVALVDYDNDSIATTQKVMKTLFDYYAKAINKNNTQEANKYKLYGVRLDTSSNLLDKSLINSNLQSDKGVSPTLVLKLRKAIDNAWQSWDLPNNQISEIARKWCKDIKIIASSGFNLKSLKLFNEKKIPVDIYGIGSSFFSNSHIENTNNDFTLDIVKVKINNKWYDLSKIGRKACDNPTLEKI